jgi:hypothetical protein
VSDQHAALLREAHGKRLVDSRVTGDGNSLRVWLQWDDGTWTNIFADYEAAWSDMTPGEGFTFQLNDHNPDERNTE